MGKKEERNTVELQPINVKRIEVTIVGDGDLILNKMNDVTIRQLTDARKDKAKSLEKPNVWEEIITSMHWYNGKPTDFSEKGLEKALKDNIPCISAFGLHKSLGETLVRQKIETYSTTFRSCVNIVAKNNLIPITFAEHYIDEKLMSPKKGAPVLTRQNRFSGWSATFVIEYMDSGYSAEQLINLVNRAGFGAGIGSGRSSGYGRYHVESVAEIG